MAWLRKLTALVWPLFVLAPIILTLSCGGGSTTQGTAATPLFDLQWPAGYSYDPATATLTVPSSQRHNAVVSSLTVTSITCTVTGSGMTAITASISPTTLQGTVYVPLGSSRVFSVTITTSVGLTITGSSGPVNITAGFTGPVSITLTPNNPPVVTSVTVNNSAPPPSTNVTVTCNATDADTASGDQLAYQWTTTEYTGPSTTVVTTLTYTTASIQFFVPNTNRYTFTCLASDLRGGVSNSMSVDINAGGPSTFDVSGYAKYSTSPIQNVTVKVCNTADSTCIAPVTTTLTNAAGFYSFAGMTNGSYNLRFYPPAGWPSIQAYWQAPITGAGVPLFVNNQLTKTPISFTPTGNITLPTTFNFNAQPEAANCTVNIYNLSMTFITTSGAVACAGGNGSWYFAGPLTTGDYKAFLTATDGSGNQLLDSVEYFFNNRLPGPAEIWTTPGNGNVTIDWTAVVGATSYNLYWSAVPGVTPATGTPISGVAAPYLHTPLTNMTTYYYVVTAVVGGSETEPSLEVAGTPNAGGLGAILGNVYYSQTAQQGVMVSVWDSTCVASSFGSTFTLQLGQYSVGNLGDGNYCVRVEYPAGWPSNIIWTGISFSIVGGGQAFQNFYLTKWVTPVTPLENSFLPAGQNFVQATWTANPEATTYQLWLYDVTGGYALVEGPVSPIAGMVVNFASVLNTNNRQYQIKIIGKDAFNNEVVNYWWYFTTQP